MQLPGPSLLRLELYDADGYSRDELIGATEIDLEERYFNEGWRALGQPIHVTRAARARITGGVFGTRATPEELGETLAPKNQCEKLLSALSWQSASNAAADDREGEQAPLSRSSVEGGGAADSGGQSGGGDGGGGGGGGGGGDGGGGMGGDVNMIDDSEVSYARKPIERRTLRLPGAKNATFCAIYA
eukprot:COSAG06_NODE_5177_length_3657_cov_4.933671_4_plen_187_part_00